jgi:hypothetical protein
MAIPAVGASEWLIAAWLNGGPKLLVAAGPAGNHHATPEPPVQLGIWQPGDTTLRVATVTDKSENYALVCVRR